MTYKLTKTSLNPDPYYGAVSLLLSGDGANNSTDIRDSSRNTKAITVAGDAKISTAQSKFGGASIAFDGSWDYLTSNSGDFAFGTADFTVELYAYAAAPHVDYRALVTTRPDNGPWTDAFHLGVRANGVLLLYSNTFHVQSSANAMPVGEWCHVALVRSSGIATIYVNGVSVGTGSFTNNVTRTLLGIGDFPVSQSEPFNGYIDDLRITKGVARYTANFTPPTQPFLPTFKVGADPEFYNTSLLLHGDGTNGSTNIVDSSVNPKTVTAVGNAQISTAQSKFGGTSLRFDGTGDYLTALQDSSYSFGTGDFTIEVWLYITAYGGGFQDFGGCLIDTRGVNTLNWPNGMLLCLTTNGSLRVFTNVTVSTSTSQIPLNTWTHVSLVRSGGSVTFYIGGQSAGTFTFTNNLSQQDMTIGTAIDLRAQNTALKYIGYIDDLRITKGVARYTANFTPPTQPFPNF